MSGSLVPCFSRRHVRHGHFASGVALRECGRTAFSTVIRVQENFGSNPPSSALKNPHPEVPFLTPAFGSPDVSNPRLQLARSGKRRLQPRTVEVVVLVEAAGMLGANAPRPSPGSGPPSLRSGVLRSPVARWSNPERGLSSTPTHKTPKGRPRATLHRLVEAAGIEPASASPPPQDLHAYPRLLI